jgi:hypothetical protein
MVDLPDALTRLLDLLIAWSDYHASSEDQDQIADLYQEAGALVLIQDSWRLNNRVSDFLKQRLFPFIMTGNLPNKEN